ncbi:hypothetical protein ACEI86_10580 [Clostridioides difficile]|uniref:hypothetical protein n=1 Tax=Clostridioides difficile TaxID=1496 RepID=UPI001C1A2D9C|nr:hypothetical protein [Clostridioides difficile]HBE9816198.1 hypothetical protein [Clostridioides difficile]HBF3596719.1 hypothetical protein [Clostridioides difficile]HBG0353351.1 hypothetical protein [Clostridioides difficile]HBG3423608.1 hypothetical protein [Clostridioides difficile]
MFDNNRTLDDIKNDIKVIKGNKLSVSQSKLLFIGIMFEIILSKDIFSNNSILKEFVNIKLLKYMKMKEPFREYLFSSRTLLIARIQKEIYTNLNYQDILEIVDFLQEIIVKSETKEDNKKRNKKNPKDNSRINEWMNFTNKKDSKEV